MIMSQTQIFNFFPGSIHSNTITRTLSSFAKRYKNTCIPTRNVWINKVYFEISNSREKQCLTGDTRDGNDLGLGKFRTQADNEMQQICYYNRNKTDTSFNSFLASREQTSQEGEIKFSIVKVVNNINNTNVTYSALGDKLNSFNNDNIQSKLQRLSEGDVVRTAIYKDGDGTKTNHKNIQDMDELAKSQDFFQDNNAIGKKIYDYSYKIKKFSSFLAQ